MKWIAEIGAVSILMIAGGAYAGVYALEGTGVVDPFLGELDGADSFPFAGLSDGDSMGFHFEYDTEAIPVYVDGFIAEYELDGGGSYMQLGGSQIAIETLSVMVGEFPATGHGVIQIMAENASLGFSSTVFLRGEFGLPAELPTFFELNETYFAREISADSDQNQTFNPIVFGTVLTAQVTPSPGTLCFLLGGTCWQAGADGES
jgi:hypothetical protein